MCLSLLLNIILISSITKKRSGQSFCSRFKLCFNGFNVSICFQNYYAYHFFCSRGSTFSVKEIFHDQGISPQKKIYGNFSQIFFFPWSGKFSTKKIYGGFPQKRLFPDQVIFLEVKVFLWSEEFFYKGKSFDIFNTKSLHKRCFSSIIHFCSFLYFSCEVVHYRKKSIYIFQEIFASTNKTFILRWRLSTRQ